MTGILLVLALWLASGFAALGWLRQRRAPRREEPLPHELAGRAELVHLRTRDGEDIAAWFLDAETDEAPSVVELHGNGGTRRARLGAAEVVREPGCAVLLVTQRAHGDSSGELNDFGWSARLDVVAAVEWLERRRPGRPIALHGASLGAAAAVFAADELGARVQGYALECLYRDLDEAAWNRCRMYLPAVADRAAYWGLRAAAAVSWPAWKRLSAQDALASLPPGAAVLVLSGELDRQAPLDGQRELVARSPAEIEHVVIRGAEHDRLQSAAPDEYRLVVQRWIARVSATASSRSPR